jgi:hypothetical protein
MRERADSNWRRIVRAALLAPGVLLALSPFAGLAGTSPQENQWEPTGPLALRHPEIFVCIGRAVTAEADRLKDWNEVNKLVDSEKFYQPIINKCSRAYPDQAESAGRTVLETDVTAVLEDWLKPRIDAALAAKQAKDEQLRKQAEADEERARRLYIDCLFAKTETLALASTEPAQIIVQAAVGACSESRKAIEDKAIRAGRDPAEEANNVEKRIDPKLTLDVIITRARQTPQPATRLPEPKPHETPI